MQELPTTFRELINRWPSTKAFGREICGDGEQGRVFRRRNRVPKTHWQAIIDRAPTYGLEGLTKEHLAALYEAGRGEGR